LRQRQSAQRPTPLRPVQAVNHRQPRLEPAVTHRTNSEPCDATILTSTNKNRNKSEKLLSVCSRRTGSKWMKVFLLLFLQKKKTLPSPC